MQLLPLGLVLEYTAVGGAELLFVEALAEALGSLGYFLVDFLFDLGQLILDEDVSTVALLRVLVVDEGVVEGVDVSRSLPDLGMHKDRRVDPHDIGSQEGHCFPPVAFDIVLQFAPELAVVVDSAEAVIDFGGGEDEAVFLTVGDYLLEEVFLLCH